MLRASGVRSLVRPLTGSRGPVRWRSGTTGVLPASLARDPAGS